MLSPRTIFLLFNFIGLQVTWAACAYGAINDMEYIGVIVGFLYILLHFIFTKSRVEDITILLTVGSLGIAVDSMNTYYEILSFSGASNTPFLLPFWLIVLWGVFSLMIPHSLYWLSRHKVAAVIGGAVGGSFSYWLGHKLGAISLSDPLLSSVAVYFVQWGLIFPVGLFVTKLVFTLRKQVVHNS